MGGSAVLGTNLVDSLVGVADSLRRDLHPAFGVRQWNVTLVRRHWDGGSRGEGSSSFSSEMLMDPQPRIRDMKGVDFRAMPYGREEEGELLATEVSLTYTEAELSGGTIAVDDDFYWRLTDAQGQAIRNRYYVPAAPPVPDRDKDIGWRVQLRRAEVQE